MRGLRWMVLVTAVLVLAQSGIGMVVNLYVTIPSHHPGADPANYFTGSYRSVAWAVSAPIAALASHAGLGLLLVLVAAGVAVRALVLRAGWVAAWLVAGALLVIGAGFNGASFLDHNLNVSSLIMALLAFASLLCYLIALYLLPSQPRSRAPSPSQPPSRAPSPTQPPSRSQPPSRPRAPSP
jgi:hypothetical protein